MGAPFTDEEIINKYKEGERESFKLLVLRYTSSIFNFVSRLSDRENAKDITQDTFIKAWKKISKFDPGKASFKTWLFAIAKNTAMDFLRKKKTLVFTEMPTLKNEISFEETVADEDILPDKVLEKIQNKEMLDTVLEKLSIEEREIISLHYQEDMTFEVIGQILGIPINTAKSKHRRALIKMRSLLE
jgi:RNA polymerase sigma-70 factor (ECF subfamily)